MREIRAAAKSATSKSDEEEDSSRGIGELRPSDLSDREKMLKNMEATAMAFYVSALAIGHHQFIEFAGFINEYIKMCRDMLNQKIDFAENELRATPHQIAYIAEKLDCIFGQALADEKTSLAFREALKGYAKKRGAPWAAP